MMLSTANFMAGEFEEEMKITIRLKRSAFQYYWFKSDRTLETKLFQQLAGCFKLQIKRPGARERVQCGSRTYYMMLYQRAVRGKLEDEI